MVCLFVENTFKNQFDNQTVNFGYKWYLLGHEIKKYRLSCLAATPLKLCLNLVYVCFRINFEFTGCV